MLLLAAAALAACTAPPPERRATPLIPIEEVTQAGGVTWRRAPFHVRDSHLQLAVYDAQGQIHMQTEVADLFPTDVLIVYDAATQQPSVFLRRSPHGGCLLNWDATNQRFEDPCYGSQFDRNGNYVSGPSPRNLDRLQAAVRDNMIWVINEVLYGEPSPVAK